MIEISTAFQPDEDHDGNLLRIGHYKAVRRQLPTAMHFSCGDWGGFPVCKIPPPAPVFDPPNGILVIEKKLK